MNVCIAVISNTNNPLYLKTSKPSELLPFNFRVHGALDIIEDKIDNSSVKKSYTDKESSNFLGLLYSVDDYCVYGYVTNTNVKFVVVQEAHTSSPEIPSTNTAVQLESKIRKTFESLHEAYLDLISSPFYTPNTPINPSESASAHRFEEAVAHLLEHFGGVN